MGVAGIIGGDFFQMGLHDLFQHRDFIEKRGIEDHICQTLELENISSFPFSHIFPREQRFLRAMTAELHIPHHAAQQAGIGGGNAVVIIDGELRQGTQIDAHALVARHEIGEPRIQRMKAFHQDRLAGAELHLFLPPLFLPCHEIEMREPHFFPFQERHDRILKKSQIDGMDFLPILPIHLVAIVEIIIQREHHRMDAIHPQVYDEALQKSGLSR